MKKMQNILFTCAGGAGVLDLAEPLQSTFQIFLADGSDQTAARYSDFPFKKIPFGSSPSYEEAMRSVIREWDIDCVVPGADEELLPLARLQEEHTVLCVMPERRFIETCLNKKKALHALHKRNISSLLPFEKEEEVHYPVVAKPVYGRGSRQMHRIDTKTQLSGYLQLYDKTFSEVLVQPYIEGKEYTVSAIVNNRNHIIGIVPKKVIEKRGITRVAVSEKNIHIEQTCKRIVETMHPCGPFNVQLIMQGETCYIFEINPRLSTTAVLTEKAFGNEVALCIQYGDKDTIESPPTLQEGVTLYRYESHHFERS